MGGVVYPAKKMTEITKCPKCNARFKVTEAQLNAHEGLVRCGRCHHIFDANKYLHDYEPSRQLSLPIEDDFQTDKPEPAYKPNIPKLETERTTLAQQVQFVEELTDEVLERPADQINGYSIMFPVFLLLVLLAQFSFYFRVELGAHLPGLKPLLSKYCSILHCTVALPQEVDLIAIDSSELESDPDQSNLVTLHVLVHNRAPFAQAHPSLELTLTNLRDQVIARRVFHPSDYLNKGDDGKLGVPAHRDLDIRLRMDTTDLKPTGYRVFLFYPK